MTEIMCRTFPLFNVHTEISDVAIEKDTLAVHVFVTNLDWLLPDEIIQNPQSKNITLFWSLDTLNPSRSNLRFQTLIRKSLVEGNKTSVIQALFSSTRDISFASSVGSLPRTIGQNLTQKSRFSRPRILPRPSRGLWTSTSLMFLTSETAMMILSLLARTLQQDHSLQRL